MIYVALAIASFVLQAFGNREFTRRFPGGFASVVLYNGIMLSFTTVLCAMAGGFSKPTGPLIFWAAAFGVLFVLTIMLMLKAIMDGPLSLVTLITNMSMLIPIVFGLLVWGEAMSIEKGLGILCVLGVLALSAFGGKGSTNTKKKTWIVPALAAMTTNGILTVILKSMTRLHPEVGSLTFCFWGFAMGAVIAWLMTLALFIRGERFEPWLSHPKALFITTLATGVGTTLGNVMLMTAMVFVAVSVLSPLVQGSVILLVWLMSATIYKERVRLVNAVMVLVGIVGIALLSAA